MPEFYRTALAPYFSPRELVFLEILVGQLQTYTTVTIEGLAIKLPLLIVFESRRRRVQRFLDLAPTTVAQIWLSLLGVLLPKVISVGERVYLALDRTQWKTRTFFCLFDY